jgi:FkbM family methyltransferase
LATVSELLAQGTALSKQGGWEAAIAAFSQAVQLEPADAKAHYYLGTTLARQGRLDEAVRFLSQACQLNPTHAGTHNNLGNALRNQGCLDDAISHFREALRLEPRFADGHYNLGLALLQQGRPDLALSSFQQAVRLKPDHAPACASLEQLLKRNPNLADAQNDLGNAFAAVGRLDEAVACFEQALRANPTYAPAYNNLGNARKDQGQIAEAIACYRQAAALKPDRQECASNLLYSLTFDPAHDAGAILEEHRRWQQEHARFAAPSFANEPSPERRLRIGYVSPDFRDHVVGENIWPLLRHHDRKQFEITLYANVSRPDTMTEQLAHCAHTMYNIAGWPDERVVETIKRDGIDILVDLALHMIDNRVLVFARKPAPVQVTFAGYPGTTGLAAIDYRLTDPYLDPPGEHDDWYAEKSVRLPHSFWCYAPRTEEPSVGPLPALTNGFVTFGCLNNFCKINESVLELWAQVLRAVEGSRLLLLAKEGSHRQRTRDCLARLGIAPERVEFHSRLPRPEYLALHHQMDLGLDSFPYNGHTTSLDDFWMGVPVVTLVGKTVVGRAGLSQLSNLGLPELATFTPEKFVQLAVDLAKDLPRLRDLRAGLRQRMKASPLMDAQSFAGAIEVAYRTLWRKWCEQKEKGGSQATAGQLHTPEPTAASEPQGYRRLSLYRFFDDLPRLKVIDVGASPIDGPPPYQALFDAGHVELVGFEPDAEQHRRLVALERPNATYLPYAVGDGAPGVLHVCKSAGMTSLLEPDQEILKHFHGLPQWGTVLRTIPVQTKRLDDLPEVIGTDYLKLDIQGGELAALRGAAKLLAQVLVVHLEVQFVPFYKNQPLFAELDQALRQAGFFLHRFQPIMSLTFTSLPVENRPDAGMSQHLWSDAVYVRRFTDFARLDEGSLLKLAALLNDLYDSFDFCALALEHADCRANTQRARRYREVLGKPGGS